MNDDDQNIRLVRVEERIASLRTDLAKVEADVKAKISDQKSRIDKQDGNIRWAVLAVLAAVISSVMKMVAGGGQ